MNSQESDVTGKVLRGAIAGLVAGIAASFVMDRFQAGVASMSSSDADTGEPATEKAADGIAMTLTGTAIAEDNKPLAGQTIHYALGAVLGVAYGIAAEFRPAATSGFGAAFGVATATVLDEIAVPAVGLGKAPWQVSLSDNLYSYASHLVFGSTTEFVRRQVRATLNG